MARIAGVNIPREKRVEVGLTYIYGIGRSTSLKVLAELGLSPDTKVRDLTEEEVAQLRAHIDGNLTVEGDLRRERSQNVKRLMEIGCYRGLRHRRGLPVDGQRTRTNARTRKGPKKSRSQTTRAPAPLRPCETVAVPSWIPVMSSTWTACSARPGDPSSVPCACAHSCACAAPAPAAPCGDARPGSSRGPSAA